MEEPVQWWGVAWAWVGGYSATATLVTIFNMIIVFSVATNKYLHYSYNYVLVMLSLRCPLVRWRLLSIISVISKSESPKYPQKHKYLHVTGTCSGAG